MLAIPEYLVDICPPCDLDDSLLRICGLTGNKMGLLLQTVLVLKSRKD